MSRGDVVQQQIKKGAIITSVRRHLDPYHSFIDDLKSANWLLKHNQR